MCITLKDGSLMQTNYFEITQSTTINFNKRYERIKEIRIKEYALTGGTNLTSTYVRRVFINFGNDVPIEGDVIQANGNVHNKIPIHLSKQHIVYNTPRIIANFQNHRQMNSFTINIVDQNNLPISIAGDIVGSLGILFEFISAPFEQYVNNSISHAEVQHSADFGLFSSEINKRVTDLPSASQREYYSYFANGNSRN